MTDGTADGIADEQIHDALRAFTDRYEVLREERPDDFVCGRAEYWAGFSS
ncbi:hypothetical protein [Streptomyces sp. NRRL S-1022]|nr:hypothetical protein [Streptomyces sp. NRRL S-1022]